MLKAPEPALEPLGLNAPPPEPNALPPNPLDGPKTDEPLVANAPNPTAGLTDPEPNVANAELEVDPPLSNADRVSC